MNIAVSIIILLCLKCCLSIFPQNNDLKMITDVIDSYNKPTVIVAKVCWKMSDKVKLAKRFASLKTPKNIRFLAKSETINNSDPNNHIFFLMDIHCEDSHSFLKQVAAENLFSKTYRWLVIGKPKHNIEENSAILNELEIVNILPDSEVIVAQEIEENIVLHTVYKISPRTELNIEPYGTWSLDHGLNKTKDERISNVIKRKDLKGETLNTAIVISDNKTKTNLLGFSDLYVDTISKMSFRNVKPLYEFLNATINLVFADTWGYFINNSWNGMIGEINLKRAELCGTVTFITKDRKQVLEYLTQPNPSTAKFVFRQPPLSYQNNLYLLAFTTNVWYCAGVFVFILIFILYISTKWDIKKYKDYNEKIMDQTCLPPTWSDITIFVLSAVSQQGSSNELKGTLGRFVMLIMFLAFLFIYTSYSANIVALLQSTSNQIRTLSDLLNSKLELGVEDVAYNRYYFSANYISQDPLIKAIYETKVAPKGQIPNFLSPVEGVKRMQTFFTYCYLDSQRPFAFNMNIGTGYKIIASLFQEHEKCGLQEIDFIQDNNPWLCCRKNSSYSELFKIGFMRIQEHGVSDRENNLIYAKKPVCSSMGGNFGSVNMVDFYPVLLMLLYGMILALVLFVIELLVHSRMQKKNRNTV